MKRALWLIVALAPLTGCVKHFDLELNAPGNVEINKPPVRKNHKLEKPQDPGENMLAVTGGGFAGGGLAAFGTQQTGLRGAYGIGPEVSIVYGTSKRSHAEDDFVIFPRPAYGVNLGWIMLTYAGKGLGPVYAELQYSDEVIGFGAGWAYDANDAWNGPQLTTSIGPVYMRATYLPKNGLDLQIGLDLKAGFLWIWSR